MIHETMPPGTHEVHEPDELHHPTRRRTRLWLAIAGALIVASGIGLWLWTVNTTDEPAPALRKPAATAVIERGNIAATNTWGGSLEYGEPFTVNSSAEGTITWLVDEGETLRRGDELYRVNERPVTLLLGMVPMYRDLAPGAIGIDVKELERNLSRLGHDGFTVDQEYTASTAEAVRDWQDDLGAEQTGVVTRADVVFVPRGRRVEALWVGVGDVVAPGAPVLDITATDEVVRLEIDVDDRELMDVGIKARIVLPAGDEMPGTVKTTAVVAVPSEDAGGGLEAGAEAPESNVQVEITLQGQVADALVGAPVDVIVAIDKRTDVLLVPVNALLALAEGGYGLEVVDDDGSTRLVPVDTGLFAEGKVEVEGAGIAEGMIVGTAGR